MQFGLSEEQDMIVSTVRSFVENEIYPHEAMVERNGTVPLELGKEIKTEMHRSRVLRLQLPRRGWRRRAFSSGFYTGRT